MTEEHSSKQKPSRTYGKSKQKSLGDNGNVNEDNDNRTSIQQHSSTDIQKPVSEKPNSDSDNDGNDNDDDDNNFDNLRNELGLGRWKDEFEAIDNMPSEQLNRMLPTTLLNEEEEDGNNNNYDNDDIVRDYDRNKSESEDEFGLTAVDKLKAQLVQNDNENVNDDKNKNVNDTNNVLNVDSHSKSSHSNSDIQYDNDEDNEYENETNVRMKKPKGTSKKDVEDIHRETARMVREQNLRLESNSKKMTLSDFYVKLAQKREKANEESENVLKTEQQQSTETTVLSSNENKEVDEHLNEDKDKIPTDAAEDWLVRQDMEKKKKNQTENLKLMKMKALEMAKSKSKSTNKDNVEEEEDIEVLPDNPKLGPLARASGARLGAGKESPATKMSSKSRWDSKEAHKIRKFVGISERGKSGAKRRRSSEGTPNNKKNKMLSNEELMENIKIKALNHELKFQDEIEQMSRVKKPKYVIPKPKTQLSEKIDPLQVALQNSIREKDDGFSDNDDENSDEEDGDWELSGEEEDEGDNVKGSGSEEEEVDENENEKENHSSFSSNATSKPTNNKRKPLGEAKGHVYESENESENGSPRGFRRIRRIIHDDEEEVPVLKNKEHSQRLYSPFGEQEQSKSFSNEGPMMLYSQSELGDLSQQLNEKDKGHTKMLKRNSIRDDESMDYNIEGEYLETTQQGATQSTQSATQAQAATQSDNIPEATQVEDTIPNKTQSDVLPTLKNPTQKDNQQSDKKKDAFTALKEGMNEYDDGSKELASIGNAKSRRRFFEAQAEESDEENLAGLISEDEEDGDSEEDKPLEELVNDEQVAKDLREKQDKLATEKYMEQRAQDDELDRKVAQDAVDGRYRYRRRNRTEDGLDLSSDDDDVEFMKAQEQLQNRIAKKRHKQAGEEPMDILARNPKTAAFAAVFEAPTAAEEFEADFDVEHDGPIFELTKQENDEQENNNDDDDESNNESDNHNAIDISEEEDENDDRLKKSSKFMTLKEEAEAMRSFMKKKYEFRNISSDEEDVADNEAMRHVRKGDPSRQRPSKHKFINNNEDDDMITSYSKSKAQLSPRQLSKLKQYANEEGTFNGVYNSNPSKRGVTSFLNNSNNNNKPSKPKLKNRYSKINSSSQQSSQSQKTPPPIASKLSSFGKWN